MQRKSKIRWKQSDVISLERELKKFNAKIKHTVKNHPDIADIQPKPMTKKQFIENIYSRADFARELNSIKRYERKGSEKPITSKTGNKVSKWQKSEIGLKVKLLNQKRERELKEMNNIDVTSQGVPLELKRGEMHSERMNALKPKKFNFDKIDKGTEWKLFVESVEKQVTDKYDKDKMERFKQNYIKGLQGQFNSQADEIVKMIQKLSPEIVVNTFFGEQEATIDFLYDKFEEDARLEIIKDIWENASDR